MATAAFYAPEIDNLIRFRNTTTPDLDLPFDTKAQALVALIKNIAPSGEHRVRSFWIPAKRGPIEAFGDYDQLHDEGEFGTPREFKDQWLACYPTEECWYTISYAQHQQEHLISINGGFSIRFARNNSLYSEREHIDVLLDWLLKGTEDCIRQCAQGTYNAFVADHLPYDMRTGTIRRADLWRIFAKDRDYLLPRIADGDLSRFAGLFTERAAQHSPTDRSGADPTGSEGGAPHAPVSGMTAARYLAACASGYRAIGLKPPRNHAPSPADWYRAYANPRGLELLDIDQDSPGAFASLANDDQGTGHTWEVLAGAGFSWMPLLPVQDGNGWSFHLGDGNYPSAAEAIEFALGLHDAGLPVTVQQADALVRAAKGEDLVGAVPHYVVPAHAGVLFPGDEIIDFMTLPSNHRQEIIDAVRWQPVHEVTLAAER